MKIIHLIWITKNGFNNSGCLNLWIEDHTKLKSTVYYSYSLPRNDLSIFFDKYFANNISKNSQIKLHVPCNQNSEYIPSPIIASAIDFEDHNIASLKKCNIDSIALHEPLQFIKNLNFISYYFDEDIYLADDAKFWLSIGKELITVIKQDLYVPELVAYKRSQKTFHTFKWVPLSEQYNAFLKEVSNHVPISACDDIDNLDYYSMLSNFSEVVVTGITKGTSFTQKCNKKIEGTLIEYSTEVKEKIEISDSLWKQWQLWHTNLSYNQLGSPFQLVFKLNSPDRESSKWCVETLLQSKIDPSFMVSLSDYTSNKSKKAKIYNAMFGSSINKNLLLQLGYACRLYSPIETLFRNNLSESNIYISQEESYEFLKEHAWVLQACGYKIIVPAWWTTKGRMKAKVKINAKHKKQQNKSDSPTGYFDYHSVVGFDYGYSIGNEEISRKEWNELLNAKSELVFFRGKWLEINTDEMHKIQGLIASSERDLQEGNIKDVLELSANSDDYDINVDFTLNDMLDNLSNKDSIEIITQPDTLQATLRPYQLRGLSWLVYLESLGMNPCLADDMGLGKTIQVLSLLLARPKDAPALIIAPTSVIGNWAVEINKFAPSLTVEVYHGSNRKNKNANGIFKKNIIITSFGMLRRDKKLLQIQQWSRIIVDEAHNIKNPSASQTKALCSLDSTSKIALTGTPIENRLMDLWSIFNFLNPNYLGTKSFFRKQFELPIQQENSEVKISIFKKMIEPFILRRVKTDKSIIKDLPDKVENKVYCNLTKEQASLYQIIVDEVSGKLEIAESKEKNNIFIASLMKLKQVCNHPAQLLQDGSAFNAERSAKVQRLLDMVKEAIINNESILIFSQFKEVCLALESLIRTMYGYNMYCLHGSTLRTKRESMVKEFQDKDTPPSVFILSLKAGGVGITLTKANHVIHFDRWWNPAIENQATDRAYRIGQQKTVFAHKYITLGTIEEKIDEILTEKQKMSDMIVGSDESWLSKLDSKSFLDLIKLRKDIELADE